MVTDGGDAAVGHHGRCCSVTRLPSQAAAAPYLTMPPKSVAKIPDKVRLRPGGMRLACVPDARTAAQLTGPPARRARALRVRAPSADAPRADAEKKKIKQANKGARQDTPQRPQSTTWLRRSGCCAHAAALAVAARRDLLRAAHPACCPGPRGCADAQMQPGSALALLRRAAWLLNS